VNYNTDMGYTNMEKKSIWFIRRLIIELKEADAIRNTLIYRILIDIF